LHFGTPKVFLSVEGTQMKIPAPTTANEMMNGMFVCSFVSLFMFGCLCLFAYYLWFVYLFNFYYSFVISFCLFIYVCLLHNSDPPFMEPSRLKLYGAVYGKHDATVRKEINKQINEIRQTNT
jgi:hypothetical protein